MKRRILTILFILLVSLIAFTSFASADSTVDYQIYGTYDYNAAQEVLTRLNDLRVSQGLEPVTLDPTLTEMAMQRAAECSINYDHVRPDGSDWYTIFNSNSAYAGRAAAENIAVGYTSPYAVMQGWTESSGHYKNMTTAGYRSVGIGCFYQDNGTIYWSQLFHSNTSKSQETKYTKVNKNNIPIRSSLDMFNLYLENYDSCAVNIYKGTTHQPRLYMKNAGWEYASRTYLSGGYDLVSQNTSRVSISGKNITAISLGTADIDYVFNSGYIRIPYNVVEKPSLSYTMDSNGQISLTLNGQLYEYNNIGVYYKEANDGYWTRTNINNANKTYLIGGTQYGDAYTCVVQYYDKGLDKWVELSDRLVVKRVLSKPKASITTIASSGKPKVTWNAVDGADKYEVWRKEGANGSYQKYYTTTNLSMTNNSTTPGKIYYYKVKAICDINNDCNSSFSNEVYIACDLPQPKNVKVAPVTSTGKPKVTWDKVAGASKYEVWRAVGSNGTYKKYYTTTGTYMTNTSATPGTIYYYKVKAICGSNSGGNSALSNKVYMACDLAQPKASITLTSKGKPKVSWKAVSGATKYEVYRAVGPNGTYEKYYTTTSLSMTNTSAKKGTTYYYKVKAICGSNSNGNSALSNKVYITSK